MSLSTDFLCRSFRIAPICQPCQKSLYFLPIFAWLIAKTFFHSLFAVVNCVYFPRTNGYFFFPAKPLLIKMFTLCPRTPYLTHSASPFPFSAAWYLSRHFFWHFPVSRGYWHFNNQGQFGTVCSPPPNTSLVKFFMPKYTLLIPHHRPSRFWGIL